MTAPAVQAPRPIAASKVIRRRVEEIYGAVGAAESHCRVGHYKAARLMLAAASVKIDDLAGLLDSLAAPAPAGVR